VKGMIDALKKSEDPYALFYSPKGFKTFQELTTGSFSGIGVWLKDREGDLEIISVLPASPALKAGMESGDTILEIDGEVVDRMTTDEAVARIKGPEGSEVTLGVERDGATLSFTIERAAIDIPNVRASMTEGNLAYIRLLGFSRGAGAQVRSEIDRLVGEGAEGVVLDMRDNGGGLFAEAIDVASVFIEDGPIVTYREQSEPDFTYEAEGEAYEDLPLVVLVNEGTASASEIVAGALQDSDRAVVVGTTTFGKGSVQEVVPLMDASALKLTTAAYVTPEGRNINGKGLDPDVKVDAEPVVQRQRAVEILKGIVLSANETQG
ncbi:MAG TPA: S41 family peptidase, partial [Actinomycetota bacterium]|nr:S41 family peptidase [Actinomycetota bacterium]